MRKRIIILFGWLIWVSIGHAQGFTIDNFKVELDVQESGAINVKEEILINFTEKKHGIYRDIPIQYEIRKETGDVAYNRSAFLGDYTLVLDEVNVVGKAFESSRENGNLSIKIGSADVWESGPVTYTIEYIVYDVVNQFIGHDEIYWNLTGNEWPTGIKNVDFTVKLPKNHNFSKGDIRVFTGFKNSTEEAATFSVSNKQITGSTTRSLKQGEGVTLGVKFPSGYFKHQPIPLKASARNHVIKLVDGNYTVNTDGTVDAKVRFRTEAKYDHRPFTARISTSFKGSLVQSAPYSLTTEFENPAHMGGEIVSMSEYFPESGPNPHPIYTPTHSKEAVITRLQSDRSLKGYTQEFELTCKIYGAVKIIEGKAYLHLELLDGTLSEPIESAKFTVTLPEGKTITEFYAADSWSNAIVDPGSKKNVITIPSFKPKSPYINLNLGLVFDATGMQEAQVPSRLFADRYYWDLYKTTLLFRKGGGLTVQNEARIAPIESYVSVSRDIQIQFWDKSKSWRSAKFYDLPYNSLFGSSYTVHLSNLSAPESSYIYSTGRWPSINWSFDSEDMDKVMPISWSYDLLGMAKSTDTGTVFHFPAIEQITEPMQNAEIRLQLAEGDWGNESRALFTIYQQDSVVWEGPGRIEGKEIVWNPPFGLSKFNSVDLLLTTPESVISVSFWNAFLLFFSNNIILFLPIILFLVVGLLWYFVGRDAKTVTVVSFFPPENITPAEAGLLADAKLQNSDLISLIYYWAANGNLSIEELEAQSLRSQKDYELTKLKDLPTSAKSYETALFNSLFSNRTKVKISALKFTFAGSMQAARNSLEKYAKKMKFFAPGSRGLAGFIRFLSILMAGASVVTTIYIYLNPHYLDQSWGIPISFGVSAVVLFFFAKIMPRFGPAGTEAWKNLQGFREFIKLAEADRIRTLVNEHPAYFEQTLSYAIAFGLANEWAKKFEALGDIKPNWYTGTSGSYNSRIFTQSILASMSTMNRNFTAVRSSSGGSYSSSGGRSYSSGSRSYSSGSSGSSFSSRGSSGGGFGGGGGRSW